MQLIIGNKNYSTWSLRPWLLLSEFGIEFETVEVSLAEPGLKERLANYSASCKVPVLIDNGLCVWDSLAICEYVSEQFLNNRGWPEDPVQRAKARVVAAEMHSSFAALRNEMPMNIRAKRRISPSEQALSDVQRIDEIWSTCMKEKTLEGPWLFGQFSIADCMFAPVALRFETYGIEVSESAASYIQAVKSNASVCQWIEDALQETEVLPVDEAGEDV